MHAASRTDSFLRTRAKGSNNRVCGTHVLTHTCGVSRVRMPSSAGPTPSRVCVSIFSKLPSFRLTNGFATHVPSAAPAASFAANSGSCVSCCCATIRNVSSVRGGRRQQSPTAPVSLMFQRRMSAVGHAADAAADDGERAPLLPPPCLTCTKAVEIPAIMRKTTAPGEVRHGGRDLRGIVPNRQRAAW